MNKNKNWRYLTPEHIRAFRKREGLSWTEFARTLGYSRSYLGHIERKIFPITKKFALRFMATVSDRTQKQLASRAIISRHKLPQQLEIIARPRKCPGCSHWFVWGNEQRRYCDNDCKRTAQHKARMRQHHKRTARQAKRGHA